MALSRHIAATAARIETREVLSEQQKGEGWSQPSLFSPWQVEPAMIVSACSGVV